MKIIAALAIAMLGTMNACFSMASSQLEAEIILDARYLHTAVKLFEIEMLQTPASQDALLDFNLSVKDPNYMVVDPESVGLLAELLAPNQKVCPVTRALLIAHPLE